MQRRRALGALAAPWCGAAWGGAAWGDSAAPAPAVLVAHGPGGIWVAAEDSAAAQRLHDGVGDGAVGPVAATAAGCWAVVGGYTLRGWRRGDAGTFEQVAERRFELPAHALAASDDGQWVLAAQADSLMLLDCRGQERRRYAGTDLQRRWRGTPRRLFHHPGRHSFVATFPDLGELWEIPLDPKAEPIFDGLVHDYRMGEGIAQPGYLGVRRAPLGERMADLVFCDARVAWLAGRLDERRVAVVHLDVRRQIAAFELAGAQPQAASLQRVGGAWHWWLPAGGDAVVIDASRWQVLERQRWPGAVRAAFPHGRRGGEAWAWIGIDDREVVAVRDAAGGHRFIEPEGRLRAATAVRAAEAMDGADPNTAERHGARIALATERPAALHLWTALGQPLRRWALQPEDAAVDSLRVAQPRS